MAAVAGYEENISHHLFIIRYQVDTCSEEQDCWPCQDAWGSVTRRDAFIRERHI